MISVIDSLYCYNTEDTDTTEIYKAVLKSEYFTSIPNVVITTKQKIFKCGKKYRITIEEIPCEK